MDAALKRGVKIVVVCALAALLLLIPLVRGANDVASVGTSNGTTTQLTATWTEYNNISIATGSGNTSVYLSAVVSTNSTQAKLYGRIKRDGTVIESINLSQSVYPETATLVIPVAETEATHIYTFEAYCTSGKLCTISNRTFSAVFIKTGSYGTLTNVTTSSPLTSTYGTTPNIACPTCITNTTAQITRTQVIGQEGVDTGQNNSISALQTNDTYFNSTVFPNSTQFRNDSIAGKEPSIPTGTSNQFLNGAKIWIVLGSVNISDFIVAARATIQGSSTIFYNSATGQISDMRIDYANTTVAGNLANWNATYNATYDAKEPAITPSSAYKYYGYNKTFMTISNSHIPDFVEGARSAITAGTNLTYLYGEIDDKRTNYPNSTLATYNGNFPNTTVMAKEATWDAKLSSESDPLWSGNYSAFLTHVSNATMDKNAANLTGVLPNASIPTSAENTTNKNTSIGTSDTLYPTQNAVKKYVDSKFNGSVLTYQNFSIPAGQTKNLSVNMSDIFGFYDVTAGGYILAGQGSFILSWKDGGYNGGEIYHSVVETAHLGSGSLTLGSLYKTTTGATISIQNSGTSSLEIYVGITTFTSSHTASTVTVI